MQKTLPMLNRHDINNADPYTRPVFNKMDKLRRFCWGIAWTFLCRWTPNPMHGWRIGVLRLFGASIGHTNFIYPKCKIWAPWLLKTDDVVTIASGVEIYNPGGIFLGHHSIISQDAYLCGATHDYNSQDFTYIAKKIIVEPYVWICAKAIVLPGVHCFEGSVLGAGSVMSKNMDSWTVYGGNPATAIRKRNAFIKN